MSLSVGNTLKVAYRVFDGCVPYTLGQLHMVEAEDIKISEDGRSLDLTVHLTKVCNLDKQKGIEDQILRHLAGDFGILGATPEARAERLGNSGRLKIHFVNDYDEARLDRAEIPEEDKELFRRLVRGQIKPAAMVQIT